MATENNFRQLIEKIEAIITSCHDLKLKLGNNLNSVRPEYLASATNLIHYLALRNHDIRLLQESLADLGISSIGRPESHVMSNLVSVNTVLHVLAGVKKTDSSEKLISIKEGAGLLANHAAAFFKVENIDRKVKIMVTLPSESANNYSLVEKLIKHGANCMRINCAHDNETVWLQMIQNVKLAATNLGKPCPVFMDLGGPKLRTGAIAQGKKVFKIRPTKNKFGEVTIPFIINIVSEKTHKTNFQHGKIVVKNAFFDVLKKNTIIKFFDARGSKRKLIIEEVSDNEAFASLDKTAYITEDTVFYIKSKDQNLESNVLDFPYNDSAIALNTDDFLVLHAANDEGEGTKFDAKGNVIPAHISCSVPEIYSSVKKGEKVKFDDGTIEGIVQSVGANEMKIKISHTKINGGLLRSDKSVNFPDSNLKLNGLTAKDKKDLAFVAKYAEGINMSFVNRPEDVDELLQELKKHNATSISVSLKIETQEGFRNLPMIILKGMQHYPIGIFIARGDLAVEAGWERMAELQEEILWLCEAAHLPNILGTQVLENMIKTGIPSRAEITDAAMAQRAECVMLNKGKYAVETIEMLSNILERMHEHQYKKTNRLRKLQITDLVYE